MGRIAVLLIPLTIAAHSAAGAEPRRALPNTVGRGLDLGGIVNEEQPPAGVPSLASEPARPGLRLTGGMLAGIEIAPGARIGLGLFGGKARAPGVEQVGPYKPKGRKPGIGMSLRF